MPEEENWPLYTKETPSYYTFNVEGSHVGKGPRAQSCAFWNDFLPRLHNNPGYCFNCIFEIKVFF